MAIRAAYTAELQLLLVQVASCRQARTLRRPHLSSAFPAPAVACSCSVTRRPYDSSNHPGFGWSLSICDRHRCGTVDHAGRFHCSSGRNLQRPSDRFGAGQFPRCGAGHVGPDHRRRRRWPLPRYADVGGSSESRRRIVRIRDGHVRSVPGVAGQPGDREGEGVHSERVQPGCLGDARVRTIDCLALHVHTARTFAVEPRPVQLVRHPVSRGAGRDRQHQPDHRRPDLLRRRRAAL